MNFSPLSLLSNVIIQSNTSVQLQIIPMQVQFKRVLSKPTDGATCSLLILERQYKIMLDCGIGPSFDFSPYRSIETQLRQVKLVLISHSSLEYSGAYCFLVSQLGLSPKIFYTTQPVMRYSPLSLHERLLLLRMPTYNKKTFNRIYSEYEEMNLVKPFQKKELDLTRESEEIEGVRPLEKKIYFGCYLAGGCLGSLYWRVSFGLINILYMVEYNNYTMAHLAGIDTVMMCSQSTHLLITDTYEPTEPSPFHKILQQSVLDFYAKHKLNPMRPTTISPEYDPKLLIACQPAQLVVEVIAVLKKILNDMQEGFTVEKIGVVHYSSRFLELIKSQSEYFTNDFKGMLEKLSDCFEQTSGSGIDRTLILNNRINVCSHHMLEPILWEPSNKNITVMRVGLPDGMEVRQGALNLRGMKLFDEDEGLRSAGKISLSKLESKMELVEENKEDDNSMEIEPMLKQQAKEEQSDSEELLGQKEKKPFKSKYISAMSGIPRFVLSTVQKDQQRTDYGLRHHCDATQKAQTTIYDLVPKLSSDMPSMKILQKKQSKIQVMNIFFSLPAQRSSGFGSNPSYPVIESQPIHRTEFWSSLRVIQKINPKDVILINLPPRSQIFNRYHRELSAMFQGQERQPTLVDSSTRITPAVFEYQNELLEYRMNYLPELNIKKTQKVRATLVKEGKTLHIHLDCLDDSDIPEFRMEQFYLSMKKRNYVCEVLEGMIVVEGVKIYRRKKQVVIEGEYSEEYFKVRKALYEFLGIR